MENLKETDEFLDIYTTAKLNQIEINNSNRSISSNEIEAIIVLKRPGLDGISIKFCQTFREELTPIFLKLF